MSWRRTLWHVVTGRPQGVRRWLVRWMFRGEEARAEPAPAPQTTPRTPSDASPEAPKGPPEGAVDVLAAADLEEDEPMEVMVDGEPVVVVSTGGAVYAIDGECPHAGAALVDGDLDGTSLECPLHAFAFDITDGSCSVDPSYDVRTWSASVHGGRVWLVRPAAPAA